MACRARLTARNPAPPTESVATNKKAWEVNWNRDVDCYQPCGTGQSPWLCDPGGHFFRTYRDCIICLDLGPEPVNVTSTQHHMLNSLMFAMYTCATPPDLPRPTFTWLHPDPKSSTYVQLVMLADNSTAATTGISNSTPTPTPGLGPSTTALSPPAESATEPENSKEAPNLVAVIALPVVAALLLGIIIILLHQFRKRKKQQGVGFETGGKAELSSDGILQVEPQELSADAPEPRELEVHETPVEVKADMEFPAEIDSGARWEWAMEEQKSLGPGRKETGASP
ncbi:hypothetical protein PspLS_12103 [Pyricularia sp. CBS 133598]|nr:hypothetical protein PspLS_12103 [Pyricularia sp. CBS 133598]